MTIKMLRFVGSDDVLDIYTIHAMLTAVERGWIGELTASEANRAIKWLFDNYPEEYGVSPT